MDDLPIEMPTSGALPNWPYGKLPSWVPGAGWVYHESNALQFIYVVQRSTIDDNSNSEIEDRDIPGANKVGNTL